MVIDDLVEIAEKERASRKKCLVRCCMAAGCLSSGSKGVKEALEIAVRAAGMESTVEVRGVGCMKLCCQGPLVQIDEQHLDPGLQDRQAESPPCLVLRFSGLHVLGVPAPGSEP